MPWTTKCTGTALLGLLASCGPVTPPIDAGVPEDAGLTGIDAGVTSDDAGVDAGASDAGAIDASVADAGPLDAGAVDAGRLTLTAFPRVGAAGDSVVTLAGPGLILGGGGADVDAAFVWMRSTIVTSPTGRAGDVVILRASGSNAYDSYIFGLAPFSSVQVVDRDGRATLLRQGASTGRAFFASSGAAVQLAAGQPFISSPITVVRLDTTGQFFDFARRCGTGTRFTLTVDARQADPFAGVDPSRATGTPGTCP